MTAVLGHTWASEVSELDLKNMHLMQNVQLLHSFNHSFLQLNYREAYHKEKHMYTTVLDTFDFVRCHNFKHFFSNVSEEIIISFQNLIYILPAETC